MPSDAVRTQGLRSFNTTSRQRRLIKDEEESRVENRFHEPMSLIERHSKYRERQLYHSSHRAPASNVSVDGTSRRVPNIGCQTPQNPLASQSGSWKDHYHRDNKCGSWEFPDIEENGKNNFHRHSRYAKWNNDTSSSSDSSDSESTSRRYCYRRHGNLEAYHGRRSRRNSESSGSGYYSGNKRCDLSETDGHRSKHHRYHKIALPSSPSDSSPTDDKRSQIRHHCQNELADTCSAKNTSLLVSLLRFRSGKPDSFIRTSPKSPALFAI
jgi:hypothetical protein